MASPIPGDVNEVMDVEQIINEKDTKESVVLKSS